MHARTDGDGDGGARRRRGVCTGGGARGAGQAATWRRRADGTAPGGSSLHCSAKDDDTKNSGVSIVCALVEFKLEMTFLVRKKL
jgi:hypothetical protein